MTIEIVFETHSTTEDNETGFATGWLPGRLSEAGRTQARELGTRRRDDRLAAVFTSDLQRAIETSDIAFEGMSIPTFRDWRLRECNYGDWNGAPGPQVHGDRSAWIDKPYPNGESWRQATDRVAPAIEDIRNLFDGKRMLVIGHIATRWGLEYLVHGRPVEELAAEAFEWQPGWEYRLD
jgi:broad specificity phosphatase PhoE